MMTVPAPAPSRPSQHADDEVVVVDQLVKRYPKLPFNAVDGVSFGVRRGEVFGLLGPNGAGKTTTIGVLTTRVRPTAGRALVVGIDVARDPVGAKRALAVVPQLNNLDRSLSAKRNLLFHAAYFGIAEAERLARADRLLREFGLADRADDKVDRFSGGQAQRLMIARALMHDPQVLFLDEPTTGLDPQARLFVWDRIREQRERGISVLLTTHDLLLPGIIALTVVMTALQGTALPLVIDFSFTKEIEDRLLAPLPVGLVALEKILFGTLRALLAGAVMFPIGWLVLGILPFHGGRTWMLISFLLLGAIMGSGLGLTLGTAVQAKNISIVFAVVLTPLLFTGCSQYPWPSLSRLRWFQDLTLLNPLTYTSEGVRASMVPQVPHMQPWISVIMLLVATAALTVTGVRGFLRRAID